MEKFARVTPLAAGRFAVESGRGSMAARWGVYDTAEEAQDKADSLNLLTAVTRLA